MRYCMQYLRTANVHLVKDMGMIPYKLHKNYNVDATVATYKIGEYSYLEKEVKGLKIEFIKRVFHSEILDGAYYLRKKAKEIDMLQLFHVTLTSVVYAYVFKFYNPSGKIYLKLDCSHKLMERFQELQAGGRIFLNKFLDKVDLISVEQDGLYHEIKEMWKLHKEKIIHIPNGVDFEDLEKKGFCYEYSKKENIIVSVARIGATEKNTPLLLQAFAKIPNVENLPWKLVLIGTIEKEFQSYIEMYFEKYPKLKAKVEFKGNIEDRNLLFEEYRRAKIFALTSDFESFGIAFIEAAALGDVIISTDVGIAKELICDNNGKVVPCGDSEELAKAFHEFILKDSLQEECEKTYKTCKEKFNLQLIIRELYKHIKALEGIS